MLATGNPKVFSPVEGSRVRRTVKRSRPVSDNEARRAVVDNEQKKKTAYVSDDENSSSEDELMFDDGSGTYYGDVYVPAAPPPVCSLRSMGRRLIIDKIVVQNFKSFAGQVTLGPFHENMTAIVGPNGSGKSNIIDSLLFVFGCRAKRVRSQNLKQLIHRSSRFPCLDMTSVEVHFKEVIQIGTERYMIVGTDKEEDYNIFKDIEDSEFVVTRTLHRNGTSEYAINKKKVTLKEVNNKLRTYGIDLVYSRFLILQGEVVQIAMMKPSAQKPGEIGMLEYIEDIIGTTRYKKPLSKLQHQKEKLDEEYREKNGMYKNALDAMSILKEPMESTVEYLKCENLLTILKNKKYQLEIRKLRKSAEHDAQKKAELENKSKQIKEDLKKTEDDMKTLDAEVNETTNKLQRISEKRNEMAKLKKNAEKKKNGWSSELRQIEKKTAEGDKIQEMEEKLVELSEVPEKNKNKIAAVEKELKTLDNERTIKEQKLQELRITTERELEGYYEQRDELSSEQLKVAKKFADVDMRYQCLKDDYDAEMNKGKEGRERVERMNAVIQEVTNEIAEAHKERNELIPKMSEKENAIEMAKAMHKELKGKEERLKLLLFQKKDEYLQKAAMVASSGAGGSTGLDKNTYEFILHLKATGRINGIVGRLGDLGTVDDKYDVAVSTACKVLDYFVVEKADQVTEIVEALRTNNVGRASFFALDKMQRSNYAPPPVIPENVPRVFDLIKVKDERARLPFWFGLSNTLLANDVHQATRIGYRPRGEVFRVVALDGSIIESSGAMCGGGKANKGRIGKKLFTTDSSTQRDLEAVKRLKAEAENADDEHRETVQNVLAAEDELKNHSDALENMKRRVQIIDLNLKQLSSRLSTLKSRAAAEKRASIEVAPDKKILAKLSAEMENVNKERVIAEKNLNIMKEKVNEVNKKIEEVLNTKTKKMQTELNDIRSKIEQKKRMMSSLKAEIVESEREGELLMKQIEDTKKEILSKAEAKEKLQKELEEAEADIQQIQQKLNELEAQIAEESGSLKEKKKDMNSMSQKITTLKCELFKIEDEINTVDERLREQLADIPGYKQRLSKLSLHEIPDFSSQKSPNDVTELVTHSDEELDTLNIGEINRSISAQSDLLKTLNLNLGALEDYARKSKECDEKKNMCLELEAKITELKTITEQLSKSRVLEFREGFDIINSKLKEIYQTLTGGGSAELELTHSSELLEGILFSIRPDKKTWKNMAHLSGGEKTIASLSLVFALHYYRPTPIYFMDEVDAALDFRNVTIIAHFIKNQTKNAQFIVVSLRSNFYEMSERLVGVYKVDNEATTIMLDVAEKKKEEGIVVSKLDTGVLTSCAPCI